MGQCHWPFTLVAICFCSLFYFGKILSPLYFITTLFTDGWRFKHSSDDDARKCKSKSTNIKGSQVIIWNAACGNKTVPKVEFTMTNMHFRHAYQCKNMSSDLNVGDTNYTVGSRFERIKLAYIVHIDTIVK